MHVYISINVHIRSNPSTISCLGVFNDKREFFSFSFLFRRKRWWYGEAVKEDEEFKIKHVRCKILGIHLINPLS